MNQQCKVCGEPAAGFHFGAFTCEGCKSFFGRSYNNLNSITECKNNGECIINKKNRTACKSCRLRKCLLVGMSKSGSRYGRRSNWFKIHCLLQEQQQAAVAQMKAKPPPSPLDGPLPLPLLSPLAFPHPTLSPFLRPNNPSSPSVSSPDSDSSDPPLCSPRPHGPFLPKDFYLPVPFHSLFVQPPNLSSPFLLPFPLPPPARPDAPRRAPSPDHRAHPKPASTPDLSEEGLRPDSPPSAHSPTNNNDYSSKYNDKHNSGDTVKIKCNDNCNNNDIVNNNSDNINNNNNNINSKNNNESEDDKVSVRSKRFYLDAILGLKTSRDALLTERRPSRHPSPSPSPHEQDNPIDLSLKGPDPPRPPQPLPHGPFGPREDLKPIPLDLSV